MSKTVQPLVSCIMPTFNRRRFIPYAIQYFLRQEYENKELIIIDDGTETVKDLIPDTPSVRYYHLDSKITLGAKLNLACKYASGNIIANWDDDDWYAPRRLAYQVNTLLTEGKDLCGINQLLYYDLRNGNAYRYVYPANQRVWLLGSSLCYTKELWAKHQFADINVGMDGLFVWAAPPHRVKVLADTSIAVHMIHDNNASPKLTNGLWWHSYPTEEIRRIINGDWMYYNNPDCRTGPIQITKQAIKENRAPAPSRTIKNIYFCLVHENEDCVIDLVRNLHYHDPESVILLYNGGENNDLFKNQFPYEQFGAVVHPASSPAKHGYLHQCALDCMQFALDNFSFDTVTYVDSDQLLIRSEYPKYLSSSISSSSNIGMFSSKPKRITPGDSNNSDVWPAVQALKEYDLWKPFLKQFPDGESRFVHWTFWPSSVFTTDAVRDLVGLFKENKQLQDIMTKTKIWATEEVILPTLVKLLGYEIAANPCSYDFVKYRKSYTLEDINSALNKADVYWLHPIERKYDNPLRKHIRQRCNHYSNTNKTQFLNNNSHTNMILQSSLLDQITRIEGWLDNQEAELLISTTLKACIDLPSPHSIVEIGSYQGKSTVLLGSIAKAFFPAAKVYAIDPHNGVIGASDQGIHSVSPTLEMFKKNIANAGLTEVIETIVNYSYKVDWQAPISLLFIDGLHDYPNVSRDFWHFSNWVCSGGYIAFHDYADYYPGVQAFVNELSETGKYRKVQQAKSMIVLQKQ